MNNYWAPEGKIYVHKDKTKKLYGEMVIVKEEDDYTIEDFILIDIEKKEEYFNS